MDEKIIKDVCLVGAGVLASGYFVNAMHQKHHGRTTVGDHSMRVACTCCWRHPVESVDVANLILEDLTEKEADSISNHMWPLAGNRPGSLEGMILTVADKYSSMLDAVKPKMSYKKVFERNVIA